MGREGRMAEVGDMGKGGEWRGWEEGEMAIV